MFDLKESDLPELERLEIIGMKWAARDMATGLWAYTEKPRKEDDMWFCGNENGGLCKLNEASLQCVRWSDPEPLNIAAAIEQIKAGKKSECLGVESAEEILNEFCAEQDKKPLTCEGCGYLPNQHDGRGCLNKNCWDCARLNNRSDRYKPKGADQ